MAGRADYEERKEKRIEKYQKRIEKAKEESNTHYENYKKMTDVIPLGQPILTDHYSAKSTRNGYKKMNTQFEKSIKADEKAKYYEEKITTIEENKAISSDDPKAIEKLEQKLQELEEYKIQVKKREHAPYELQNLNQEIRRIKKRIDEIKELEELDFKDIIFEGGKVTHNKNINRIQILFENKPNEDIRDILKSHSFKWARSQGAWQRQFNKNGIYAVKRFLKEIKGST